MEIYSKPNQFFEDFLNPGKRHIATHQLAALGKEAMPILRSLFSGEAKNRWGIPYIKIGALDAGLVTVGLLGSLAKSLEPFVREYIIVGHPYAPEALRQMGAIKKAANHEIEQRWVEAWNNVFDIVKTLDHQDDVNCLLPDGSIVDIDTCKEWLQNAAYQGYCLKIEAGLVQGKMGVLAFGYVELIVRRTPPPRSGGG
jgi:hypothetical protein